MKWNIDWKCSVCGKDDINCYCDDKEDRLTELIPKRYCPDCGKRLKYHCIGYVCWRCNRVHEQKDTTIRSTFKAWILRLGT